MWFLQQPYETPVKSLLGLELPFPEAALGEGHVDLSGSCLPGPWRQGPGLPMAKAESFPGEGASALLAVALETLHKFNG